ncbi:MAG: hypothetical protein EBZ47_04990 [Chlamydiae bacterium]|nr:hypothetical protein [Chlamydiota bacterium]
MNFISHTDTIPISTTGILTGPDTHLDHLGVLCHLLNIPLLITEQSTQESAKKFYPMISAKQINISELSLEFLSKHFELIFQSSRFWNAQLQPAIELFYQKKIRFVFCPHGNSDKGFSLKDHPKQDISLIYGEHMISLLKQNGAFDQSSFFVRTGNYRLGFYKQYQSFYDHLTKTLLGGNISYAKQTILYAPTWENKETPSSFFAGCKAFLRDLVKDFNVIVKLHPLLEEKFPAETCFLLSEYRDLEHCIFLDSFPCVFPLLALADIYLGDYSSIGYDFLAFDKPMFFINTMKKTLNSRNGYFLNQCGLEIPLSSLHQTRTFIKNNLLVCIAEFREKRKKMWKLAFGEERKPKDIFLDLKSILH